MDILLEQCKRQQLHRDEQSFTREVVGAPELRCVLSFDWQLQDIVVFCNDPAKNSVLGVDPTFNPGKFNLTVTTYSNLKVVDRVTRGHPTTMGPLLLSQKKTFDSYNHFFTKIVSLNNETREILAFGTDGEEELFRAMRYTFPQAIHLRCFSHFMDNCKRQLRLSNVPEKEQKEILFDIFGRQIGEKWEQGIITHIIKIVSKFSFYVYSFVVYFERFMNLTPRAVSVLLFSTNANTLHCQTKANNTPWWILLDSSIEKFFW